MTALPVRVERIVEHLKDGTDSHVVQLTVDPRLVLPGIIGALTTPAALHGTRGDDMLGVRMYRPGSPNWRASLERIAVDPQIQTALTVVLTPSQAANLACEFDEAAMCFVCDCGRLVDIDGPQCSGCVEHGEFRDAGLHR